MHLNSVERYESYCMTHILQAQWTTSDLPLPDKSAGNYSKVEIHPKPSFVVQLCSPTKIGEFGKVKARYEILILKLFGHFTGSWDGTSPGECFHSVRGCFEPVLHHMSNRSDTILHGPQYLDIGHPLDFNDFFLFLTLILTNLII